MTAIDATLFTDPDCPWAYSASPALHVLRWRYGDALRWRTVVIGLTESGTEYERRGYTPLDMARGHRRFLRYGMPFARAAKERVAGTDRACRAIVATRLRAPEREDAVIRALQFAWFTTALVLDEDEAIAEALATVDGLDPGAILSALDDPEVEVAYRRDRDEARRAEGSAAQLQGKTATTDGAVRYTAPTLALGVNGTTLVAGGWQPLEAYDALVANLDPGLDRRPPPEGPAQALERFPDGLTTQEVAALLARWPGAPDRVSAEDALIALAAEGRARREPLGDDALWRPA